MELIKKEDQVASNLMKLSERRMNILDNPIVKSGLTEIEFRVASACVLSGEDGEISPNKKPIKMLTDAELITEVQATLKFIIRDLGIANFQGEDASYASTRFLKLLRDYYGDLTYKEIEIAFELLMSGKLDDYLPKNGKGEADRGHYQQFSVAFVSKVLLAFRAFKDPLWTKCLFLLPETEKVYSEQELRILRNKFVYSIYEAFDKYATDHIPPQFPAIFRVIEEFLKVGLIEERPEVTDIDRKLAFVGYLQNTFKTKYDRAVVKNDWEEKGDSEHLKGYSKIESQRRIIAKVFKSIIEDEKNIRDYIKED